MSCWYWPSSFHHLHRGMSKLSTSAVVMVAILLLSVVLLGVSAVSLDACRGVVCPTELLRTAMPTVSMCYESLSDPMSTSLRCVVQAVTAVGVASSKTPLATVACGCCRHVLLRSYPRGSIRSHS
uniref:Uncharacterized protein n=1 Tax=Timema genevievae TaxID=629358 RepID=A0A7R9PRU7_TIMGE|nr:unnamed protein product [Timema genevievae]